MKRIAVVTTFSQAGFEQYARRMIETWLEYWPVSTDLFCYPDEPVAIAPSRPNLHMTLTSEIPELTTFKARASAVPAHCGFKTDTYNYRFDALKFCHKPFALWHFMNTRSSSYHGLIWLDADTITHRTIDDDFLRSAAPARFDVQFLGRSYKYTECGYLYFNLNSPPARRLMEAWIDFYLRRTFRREQEWHDSWLFDRARAKVPGIRSNDLTGHLPRRQGAGHPFVNSFLGAYMDHYKGDTRKATAAPRKGDLFAEHDSEYWKQNEHAKARRKPA